MTQEIDAMIGWRLRTRRRLLGLTQKEVGLRVGVTPQMVHKWETAQCTLYAATLLGLAQALGVGPSYFFTDPEQSPAKPDGAGHSPPP